MDSESEGSQDEFEGSNEDIFEDVAFLKTTRSKPKIGASKKPDL